jgi:hypothetical protein
MVRPDFQPMRVPEEPVCIDLFRLNPVFTSLHLKSPVHVVPTLYSLAECETPQLPPLPTPAFTLTVSPPPGIFASANFFCISLYFRVRRSLYLFSFLPSLNFFFMNQNCLDLSGNENTSRSFAKFTQKKL